MMTLDEMKKKKKELGYSNQRIAELSGLPFGTVQKIYGGVTAAPRHETLAAYIFLPPHLLVAPAKTATILNLVCILPLLLKCVNQICVFSFSV